MEAVAALGMIELTNDEMMVIDGGRNWVGVVEGAATVVGGAAVVVGSVASLLAPEPTTVTKVIGYAGIVAGAASVVAGICKIKESW